MNNLIGRCVQFDISENGYKEGIIKNLNGDCVTILQDGEIYKGEYYRGQTIRERNLQFDLDHNWIEIY